MTDEEKLITICDDRFEIISKAKKHIIEATNIEMSPKEMEVLDNFLFRCWQMGWLKNDYKALEIENAELKEQVEEMRKCLDKWYSQYVDKGYTEYFYKCLLEQTKSFLFTDVSTK